MRKIIILMFFLLSLSLVGCSSQKIESTLSPTTNTLTHEEKVSKAIAELGVDFNNQVPEDIKQIFIDFFSQTSLGDYTPIQLVSSKESEDGCTYYHVLSVGTKGSPIEKVGKYSITIKQYSNGKTELVNIIVQNEIEIQ